MRIARRPRFPSRGAGRLTLLLQLSGVAALSVLAASRYALSRHEGLASWPMDVSMFALPIPIHMTSSAIGSDGVARARLELTPRDARKLRHLERYRMLVRVAALTEEQELRLRNLLLDAQMNYQNGLQEQMRLWKELARSEYVAKTGQSLAPHVYPSIEEDLDVYLKALEQQSVLLPSAQLEHVIDDDVNGTARGFLNDEQYEAFKQHFPRPHANLVPFTPPEDGQRWATILADFDPNGDGDGAGSPGNGNAPNGPATPDDPGQGGGTLDGPDGGADDSREPEGDDFDDFGDLGEDEDGEGEEGEGEDDDLNRVQRMVLERPGLDGDAEQICQARHGRPIRAPHRVRVLCSRRARMCMRVLCGRVAYACFLTQDADGSNITCRVIHVRASLRRAGRVKPPVRVRVRDRAQSVTFNIFD